MKHLSNLLIALLLCLSWGIAWAGGEPDYGRLADAIRISEGNANYGILTHYKHTSYRQACINTCKHAWKDYQGTHIGCARNASNSKIKASRAGYLNFLANRYAPRHVANDPNDLNRHWLSNVSKLYEGGI